MNVGDLLKFKTGYLGTIIHIDPWIEGRVTTRMARIWVHGIVNFQNPTYMNWATIQRSSEVVSECR